nr:hypothetical protein [Tanacetum cinerariifolium]
RRREDDDDQEGPSAGSDRGSKRRREGGEPESASTPSEPATKSPRKPPTPDRDWNKTLLAIQGSTQTWISELAKQADSRSSFNELLDTPLDFSNFIMHRLEVNSYGFTEKLDWDNPEGGDYPFDLTKPLPLVKNGNCQMVPVEYFFNNNLKYLQGGISTMKYMTSIMKTKAAQYELPCIEGTVRNIWSPVKVAYDKHALWGISHWRDQRKTFYGYARGLESNHDVYSTKRIFVVTRVEGDDVSDFAIALRMFTRSMIIQKRVEDLQLGVKRRNRLMRSDEFYKFNDGTLTRLRTSLDDITKNI